MVVEELLQLFIGKIDAQLLESVKLKKLSFEQGDQEVDSGEVMEKFTHIQGQHEKRKGSRSLDQILYECTSMAILFVQLS